ncbi:Scr1 family TA system antitoxin-like transcriptional regulator [Nonomuraea salmonea]|uniref:Scr1 family TA system antitoxin-like transcriptional regulator n=1 Tax=Nonomuraea salmonea TaxID=46181 RepID=UPI0031E79476
MSVVAARLSSLRAGAGLSMKSAADAAGLNTSTIFRIEHGLVAPREGTVRTLLQLYGEGEHVARVLSLLREERVPGWYDAPGVPLALSAFLELEDRAQIIYTYCPPTRSRRCCRPPAYALSAALAGLLPGAAYERAAAMASLITVRQQVLDRQEGPRLWAVLDRTALLDPPLSRAEDRLAQLDALTAATKQQHIALQVARPVAESGYLYQGPPFTLLRFADPASPDTLVLHLLHAPVVIEDRRRVEEHQQAFARLSLSALPVDSTADVLDEIRNSTT